MSPTFLEAMRAVVQQDPGGRGLAADPEHSLFRQCPGDLAAACASLAGTPGARVLAVTGFPIVAVEPVCGETDGAPGVLFLARALVPLGAEVTLAIDPWGLHALEVGLGRWGLRSRVALVGLDHPGLDPGLDVRDFTHLVAVERVGPGYTRAALAARAGVTPEVLERFGREVPPGEEGRCRSMRGVDVTPWTAPAHRLFEEAAAHKITTIGIGDGGNEIGMGKLPWQVVADGVALGGRIACRTATDHLILAGVSNWGAYALGAGAAALRGRLAPGLFDAEAELRVLEAMVEEGPLVDGRTTRREATVDGLPWATHAAVLSRLGELAGGHQS